jgi:hypothetical protein
LNQRELTDAIRFPARFLRRGALEEDSGHVLAITGRRQHHDGLQEDKEGSSV